MKLPLLLRTLLILPVAGTLSAQGSDFYYDMSRASNSAWFGANAWSLTPYTGSPVYNQTWDNTAANNNVAYFTTTANYTVNLGGNTVNFGSGGINRIAGAHNLTFSNGTLNINGGTIIAGASSSTNLTLGASTTLEGNFTLAGSGYLILRSNAAFDGVATVNGGNLLFDSVSSSSTDSSIILNGGTLESRAITTQSYGSLQINSGTYSIGALNTDGSVDASFTSLSGAGGIIQMRGNSFNRTSKVEFKQDTNTTFSGTITGVLVASGTTQTLAFTKSGTGTLTLNGSVNIRETTTISGGTLLLNGGGTRQFESRGGSTAISVKDDGTVGGTSTLVIYAGDSVVVEDGGALAPGSAMGANGTLTFNFNTGGTLDLSGVSSATEWLKFDLGADTTAGTTYDQLVVTNGILNIGTGLLNFNDFAFNLSDGFGEGSYTLFSLTGSGSLSGTLGSSLGHAMGHGFYGTLALEGNNLMLNVTAVPEPSTVLFALGGLGAFIAARRRKASK